MKKAEAKWLGEEIGSAHPLYRFRRLVFQGPNDYTVEVIDNRTGERREVASWDEWDALASPASGRRSPAHCPSCGTTFDGREGDNGLEGYDPLRMEWVTDCPLCGAPNLERGSHPRFEATSAYGGTLSEGGRITKARPSCHFCDRPATWHLGWKTATMPAPAFAYSCDEHQLEGMVPLESPVGAYAGHLPGRIAPPDALRAP